jgi:GNAT superfamily N-acetyltransferase
MHIELFDPAAEPGKVAACYRMYAEGIPFDDPHGPGRSEKVFSAWMREGFGGEPREVALAIDAGGNPVGGYLLELPHRANRHLAEPLPFVSPAQRRRGYGAALLQHAAGRAAANGRTLLMAYTRRGAPGSAFAAAMGASAGLISVKRVLDVPGLSAEHLAALRQRAEQAARGYSLVSWTGPTPEEFLDGVAQVDAAMDDAPRSPGVEAHGADPQQIRDYERRSAETGMRVYSVAARCDRTGELAGLTQIGVSASDRAWGHQLITAVTGEHRGHRLGLLLKAVMAEKLMLAEPQVTRVITDNADSNQHMISINAELGFTVLDEWQSWQLEVAAVIRSHPEPTRA